jgi:mono/diheme cytochrome c family protein
MTTASVWRGVLALAALTVLPGAAHAQWFGSASQLKEGEDIYRHVCRSCHMPAGEGAKSAVLTVPALANNPALTAAGYPIFVIINGKAAMPWFNGTLTPRQIAAVTNYIRTHFGNKFTDRVTEEDVKQMLVPVPKPER